MRRSEAKLFVLIGDPVEQSLSPIIHNAAFKALGLDHIYIALRVPKPMLADAIVGAKALGIAGLNITIPHKMDVLGLLDGLNESASMVGAVNTIKNEGGKFIGFNTDGEGALRALEKEVGSVKGKRVLLLGAGGAARAIAFSFTKAGATLTIANRTVSRAQALASEIEQKLGVKSGLASLNKAELTEVLADTDILINATSVGMSPMDDRTLVTSDMIHRRLVVNDIVYKPPLTRLLKEAKQAGAKIVDGLGMLVHQAALAFEIWTGERAPIEIMEAAVEKGLGRRNE